MIKPMMEGLEIGLSSSLLPLLIQYYHESRAYDRNFEVLHHAFKSGHVELHQACLVCEKVLYKSCLRLREKLGLPKDVDDTAQPNATCEFCRHPFHAEGKLQANRRFCEPCRVLRATETRKRRRIESGAVSMAL